jgi:trk system potassium uptake protein TrkA
VAARIYDPRRAEVYERLGIPTVATVRWTADQMLRKLLPEGGEPLWRDPTGKIVLAEIAFSPHWIGEQVKSVETSTLTRIAFVDRLGQAFVPDGGTVLQEGDVIHVVAREDDIDRIAAAFAGRGGGH